MKRTRHISLKECYGILDLQKGATLDDVKRAYRRRAFELHPDLNPRDPDAARQFQRLNEAYVALSQVLQTESAARTPEADAAPPHEDASAQTAHKEASAAPPPPGAAGPAQERDEAASGAQSRQQTRPDDATGQTTEPGAQQRTASAAYAQEDVLRDLLNDPFARRVFEDIYSEVNRQAQSSPPPEAPTPPPVSTPPKPRKVQMEWGKHKMQLDFSHGVKGMVAGALSGWLRHQIDDEQTVRLPAQSLTPGARIRLQIRRGLSDVLSTIEITLPADFVLGKPVRLRGLGKKVGPWQGDLYLTLETK